MSAAIESSRAEAGQNNGLAARLEQLIEAKCGASSRVANSARWKTGTPG